MSPQRRPLFPRRPGRPASVKTPLRLIVTLGAVVALTAACNPFGASSRERLPEDPRFAEFTFDSDNKPKVQERTDSFNERWPGLQATEGHVTIEYSPSGLLPNPDPELWVTGVATVPDETITALMEGTTSSALLPGIYPGLYQYVPQDCHFSTIDPEFADKALAPDKEKIPHDFGPMNIRALAVSEDCNLLVFTALGHS